MRRAPSAFHSQMQDAALVKPLRTLDIRQTRREFLATCAVINEFYMVNGGNGIFMGYFWIYLVEDTFGFESF